MKHKLTHGDFRHIMSGELYKAIDRLVVAKQNYPWPYYIQVQINKRYMGAAAVSEIRNGVAVPPETTDVQVSGTLLGHSRLVVLNEAPEIPQLGTMLWKVNNKKGTVNLLYALPADLPSCQHDSDNTGPVARLAARSIDALGTPRFFD